MRTLTELRTRQTAAVRQRGVVLFFALIALLAMSLAAVALIRSVDTSTMIAGNLALKQRATTSSDAGVENAVTYLALVAAGNAGSNPVTNAAHPLNLNDPASGYYASIDLAVEAANPITTMTWDNSNSAAVNPDGNGDPTPDFSGNSIRYVIHRMCRTSGVAIPGAKCLFGENPPEGEQEKILTPQNWCDRAIPGCPTPGQTPLIRITIQTTGPRNTISYVQAFAY